MRKLIKKKFDVVTIGGATRDIMFYSDEGELVSTGNMTKQKLLGFEYGAKILADKLFNSFGGGASNTAATFSSLGLKTACVCRIGNDDNGKAILKNFKGKNINSSFVKIDGKQATGFSVILTIDNTAKEHIVFAHRGANSFLNAKDLPLSQINTDWFYISSLPKVGWEQIMKDIIKEKKKIAWNPGGQQLEDMAKVKKYLPHIQYLQINRDEALEFKKLKNIKGLLKYIGGLGPKIVVITDGKKGAYAYDKKKYYFMVSKSKKREDTVGVGDSFASAFTSALIYDKNIKTALKWGINNSSSVVAKIGAQNGVLNKRTIDR